MHKHTSASRLHRWNVAQDSSSIDGSLMLRMSQVYYTHCQQRPQLQQAKRSGSRTALTAAAMFGRD
jgi:hypothetical protein